jgi:hypothetical protein
MKHIRSELAGLKHVKNVAQLADWLGLSVADFALAMPSNWRSRGHVTAQTVCGWGKRRPDGQVRKPGRAQLDAMARLVAEKLTARYGVTIGAWCEMNSPLVVTPKKLCQRCGRVFEIRRHTDKCHRCRIARR